MTSVDSGHSSLLIPPNPSLSQTKPSASILLNGNGRPQVATKPASPPRATTPVPSSPSSSHPSSPSSTRASSFSSSSASASAHPPLHPTPIRRGSTPKISFAPLPSIPAELKRRNSISIGVASRKNLLGGGNGSASGVHKVHMTDQEWEDYKRQFEARNGGSDVVDLGAVAKQGAKALWGKMKRGRSSSTSSTSSIASSASASTSASTSASAPTLGQSSATGSSSASKLPGQNLLELDTVEEEESPETSPTTGRRSMSSPPPVGSSRGFGSPPPRRRPLRRSVSDSDRDSSSSPSTTVSTLSDETDYETGTDAGTESESDFDPEGETLAEAEAESDPHDAGLRAATASLHQKHRLLDQLDEGSEDGDTTPRRIPSPPPRRVPLPHPSDPQAHAHVLREQVDEDDEDEEEEEGRKTPAAHRRETEWEKEHRDRNRQQRSEVLGFDPERFNVALNIAASHGHGPSIRSGERRE